MVASQLNHQVIFIVEAPSNPLLKLPFIKPIQNEDPKYLFPRGNQPLLYHQIGNINFFIFITNQ